MLNTKALAASASAAKVYVEDVFSTWLYDGNSSTQTITNGIDLSGKGGLVWIKRRDSAVNPELVDTARGNTSFLRTDSANGELISSTVNFSFLADGFSQNNNFSDFNLSGGTYASWTFRKAAKFFDVVTYTGDGNNRTISHNLGSVPGTVIIKRTDATGNWTVYHRSLANTQYLMLNAADTVFTGADVWNSTTPTSTVFSIGTNNLVNSYNATYVAYLFAHDAGGFGNTGNDNVISCGSYSGNNSATGPVIELGWEPQWILIKRYDRANENWCVYDNMRGISVGDVDSYLFANTNGTELSANDISVLPTGFQLNSTSTRVNGLLSNYIYIAIRRGPMKTPTDATKVFQAKLYTGTNVDNRLVTTDILTDMVWARQRNDSVLAGMVVGDRLRGQPYLLTGSTAAEVNDADSFDQQIASAVEYGTAFSSMTGFWVGNDVTSKLNANTTTNNHVVHAFRRAPGFFDVVAYAGTGSVRTVSHNLGVAPELMILKKRAFSEVWAVYASGIGNTKYLRLNLDYAEATLSTAWNSTTPTSSDFTVGTDSSVNTNGSTYIAYLFATCPGVSKVGTYTGNGTTLDIDCGFTNGARFVLIKRTDAADNWRVFDSTRGIVSGNDPILNLNATFAEDTGNDLIDPLSSGFTVVDTNYSNVNGATYIFLAVA